MQKPTFCNSSDLMSVSEKVCFRGGLVWMVYNAFTLTKAVNTKLNVRMLLNGSNSLPGLTFPLKMEKGKSPGTEVVNGCH